MNAETLNAFPVSGDLLEARDAYWLAFEELQDARRAKRLSESDSHVELDLRISELESQMLLTKIPFLNRLYEEWFSSEAPSATKPNTKSSSKKTKNKVG